jgi:chromatin assembly factor 1 subunit A
MKYDPKTKLSGPEQFGLTKAEVIREISKLEGFTKYCEAYNPRNKSLENFEEQQKRKQEREAAKQVKIAEAEAKKRAREAEIEAKRKAKEEEAKAERVSSKLVKTAKSKTSENVKKEADVVTDAGGVAVSVLNDEVAEEKKAGPIDRFVPKKPTKFTTVHAIREINKIDIDTFDRVFMCNAPLDEMQPNLFEWLKKPRLKKRLTLRNTTGIPSAQFAALSRMKLLSFHTDFRPPYRGTCSRKTAIISGRRPFGKEPILDYEVESDLEWEDVEDGEDLEEEGMHAYCARHVRAEISQQTRTRKAKRKLRSLRKITCRMFNRLALLSRLALCLIRRLNSCSV